MINQAIDPARVLALTTEYSTPISAILREDVVMGVTRYFLERWLPLLGPGAAALVNTLRQLDYRCRDEVITISGEALAREAAMSRRYLYTCLETPWMAAFVRQDSGERLRDDEGKISQQANQYHIRMDDPLNPADADHLREVLARLADDPLAAARAALDLDARTLWAADPRQAPASFTSPRAITARDVLQRAFPTWTPAAPEQEREFSRAADELHRHVTLIRQDGRASKIIVPQYFRRRWWKHLGHDLAWTYLALRGSVYESAEDGTRRATCWIPSLNSLLDLLGRPREWWRRNVENAAPHADWSLADFFRQIDAQKGRDPAQPQAVARQFWVALDLPIAPEDRAQYADLLRHWPPDGIAPGGSATSAHTGEAGVRHTGAHREPGGLPHPDTPESRGSATSTHTGIGGVCHTGAQGSATSAHRESIALSEAPESTSASSSSSKHPDPTPAPRGPMPAAAETDSQAFSSAGPISLVDRLVERGAQTPDTPLFRAAPVLEWLNQAWPEPVRPHTPAWTLALTGTLPARELVALILSVWADRSVQHPPRYLSWLAQRWTMMPGVAPVEHWDRWCALADLPLRDWPEHGRAEWAALTGYRGADLPFGLDLLDDDKASSPALVQDAPMLPAAPIPAPAAPASDGLDEHPGGGMLSVKDIWLATLGQLSAQLNVSTYRMWVEGAKAVAYADGVLTVRARHERARDWLAERHASIEHAVSTIAAQPITVQYTA